MSAKSHSLNNSIEMMPRDNNRGCDSKGVTSELDRRTSCQGDLGVIDLQNPKVFRGDTSQVELRIGPIFLAFERVQGL